MTHTRRCRDAPPTLQDTLARRQAPHGSWVRRLEGAVPANEVRLHLLSGFQLSVAGQPLELQPAMQRLLAFVALAPRGVGREYAAFQLWPDTNEDRAKGNLRSTLWRLKKLPVQLLVVTKPRLLLATDVWVDTRHGLGELASGAESDVLDTVLPFQALDCQLLPEWYDDWLIVERERLRQLRLRLLEARAQSALIAGHTAEAIQAALAAVSIDPLRESSLRLVIEAHLAEGNTVEAIRQFDRYRDGMTAYPGLAPSPALASLIGSGLSAGRP